MDAKRAFSLIFDEAYEQSAVKFVLFRLGEQHWTDEQWHGVPVFKRFCLNIKDLARAANWAASELSYNMRQVVRWDVEGENTGGHYVRAWRD